jgi:hypothetical protein
MRVIINYGILIITLFVIASVPAQTASAAIGDVTSVSSADGMIVVAVHPYTSKSRRKEIKVDRNNKKLYPVGILIQNYSPNKISLRYPRVKDRSKKSVYVSKYQGIRHSSAGTIAGSQFFDEGADINRSQHDKYKPGAPLPRLTMSEIFDTRDLHKGYAYYGLIYLSKRDSNNKQIAIKDVQNIEILVPYYVFAKKVLYVAEMPLNMTDSGIVRHEDVSKIVGNPNGPWSGIKYIGPENERPSRKELTRAVNGLVDCLGKSKRDVMIDMKMKNIRGIFATVRIEYDRYGKQLEYVLLRKSGNSKHDKYTNKIAEKMARCDLGIKETSVGNGVGYYEQRFSIGDPTMIKMLNDKANNADK